MITSSEKKRNNLGIYLHIPFCVRKCRYCDFLSFERTLPEAMDSYAHKLAEEIAGRGSRFSTDRITDSVYVGGGTPSLLPAEDLEEVMDAVYSCFRVADDAEITLEANPGTLTAENLAAYKSLGINRLSLGCQSLSESKLAYLGRIHGRDEVYEAFDLCRKAGFDNVNMDLMFGLPGESFEDWAHDIFEAIMLEPEHISFYSLQVEEGTEVYQEIMDGAVQQPDEVLDRKMYHAAIQAFTAAGYTHYEISNAAKAGCESRHNLKYWSLDEYLGFGLGAHSFANGCRFANTDSYEAYLSSESIDDMTQWIHRNTKTDTVKEYVFLGLRKTEGIHLPTFASRFGEKFWDIYPEETKELIGRGLLEEQGDMLRLTPLGLDLSNIVFSEYV
ncbi:MAG: radical SAM family heme chaperone HemW [Clostridiales Family XIII bacterium]|jgi:oxygen-independent coproporphyrinogen-3 oxidase|nr:radical SAM family heme chaperone HemW [Clostridiales Family XIII bacterium]